MVKNQREYREVSARQGNHSSFILPKELWPMEDEALYKLIAHWSLLRQSYVCCDDVAKNFGISTRQASNILSIIHRKHSDTIICDIKKMKSGPGNVLKTYVLVKAIKTNECGKRRQKTKEPLKNVNGDKQRNESIRKLLNSRW
ncbi:CaiF/GrlA family transcriptional regulator [Serratia quinivorans]|uniref:CaiF/GrlA family transcriptional regulator n=1 Tax=Serratia quinivorans TaxID=137545 RepID=UPI0021797BE9|nr:CaiF/GrlA family transcriptional regulator [Serratia quinivorans]CAI1008064.1 DNA-binding transcriptional activator CaiF [Serratia quinivorans]CAI1808552.1 DNA-binding transcriptional activator CaiF [Serratia quinivorans]